MHDRKAAWIMSSPAAATSAPHPVRPDVWLLRVCFVRREPPLPGRLRASDAAACCPSAESQKPCEDACRDQPCIGTAVLGMAIPSSTASAARGDSVTSCTSYTASAVPAPGRHADKCCAKLLHKTAVRHSSRQQVSPGASPASDEAVNSQDWLESA